MSVGPMGMIGSIAGTPLSQTKRSDAERAAHDTADQVRSGQTLERAGHAAGIGKAEEDSDENERDADGRRRWEAPQQAEVTDSAQTADPPRETTPRTKSPTGLTGNTIDLSG